jgi:hypothetical protein
LFNLESNTKLPETIFQVSVQGLEENGIMKTKPRKEAPADFVESLYIQNTPSKPIKVKKDTPLCQLGNTSLAPKKTSPHRRSTENEEMTKEIGASIIEKEKGTTKEKSPRYTERQGYICKKSKNKKEDSHNIEYSLSREEKEETGKD